MLDQVWAELEEDLAWRHDEIRLLSNSGNGLKKATERDRFRRAQLVMLYAHAEGFCKIALLIYVRALNESNISCSAARDELVASAFDDLFHALQYGDEKGKWFSAALPSDPKLMISARRRDFVAEYATLLSRPLQLPDAAVNTESNLSAAVLRRNLFRLGFSVDMMSEYEGSLDELVNRRNNIAHGVDSGVVKFTDYDRLQKAVFKTMDSVALAIVDSLERSAYLHPNPTARQYVA